jgi:hypothetical protein
VEQSQDVIDNLSSCTEHGIIQKRERRHFVTGGGACYLLILQYKSIRSGEFQDNARRQTALLLISPSAGMTGAKAKEIALDVKSGFESLD